MLALQNKTFQKPAAGQRRYIGKVAPPSDLPAYRTAIEPGQFGNVSTNTLTSVLPSGWPTGEQSSFFLVWCGNAWNPDLGAYGSVVYNGSGHQSQITDALLAGNWPIVFGETGATWVGRNVPTTPLYDNPAHYSTDYYVNTLSGSAGWYYHGHTYTGLTVMTAAEGGGPNGSLLNFFIGGGSAYNMVLKSDLSSLNGPPVRIIDKVNVPGATINQGAYPAGCKDHVRGGTWIANYQGQGLHFLKHSTLELTAFPGVGFSVYGDQIPVLIPAPWDCLVFMGHDVASTSPGGTDIHVRVAKITEPGGVLTVDPIVEVFPTGQQCPEYRCGGDWCPDLGFIGSYAGGGSYDLYRLTPPTAANLTTGTWAWSHDTMTGKDGATPSWAGLNPNTGFTLPYTNNGTWSKFRWIPTLKAFGMCGGMTAPYQLWVPQGM